MEYFSQAFIGMNSDDAPSIIPQGDYRDSLNLQTGREGASGNPKRQNIKSTVEIPYSPPTGTNKIIGQIYDEARNQLIFFLYNSQNKDGIYKLKNDQITKIIEGDLGFTPEKKITETGITDNYLFYTIPGQDPKYIDLEKSYSTVEFIDQYKPQPAYAPTVNRFIDNNFNRNLITLKNLQFAYRYVFNNGQISNFSPYSKIAPADIIADLANPTNAVSVDINLIDLTKDLTGEVKFIDFLVREGNNGLWNVFKEYEVKNATDIKVTYHGDETLQPVSDENAAILFDLMPKSCDAFTSFKHRNFFANTKHHHDINGDFDFTVSESTDNDYRLSFKTKGIYGVGIAFYDEKMRSSGVLKEKQINISNAWAGNTNGFSGISKRTLDIAFSGKAPSWAKYWKLLLTDDKFYEIYEQFPVNIFFYVGENKVKDGAGGYVEVNLVQSSEVLIQNHIYLKDTPSSRSEFTYIHLQIPGNVPFIPDRECFVRVLNNANGTFAEEQVLDILDGMLVINDFGISDWSSIAQTKFIIEVYKPKTNPTQVYYETGEEGVVDVFGNISPSSWIMSGDTYRVQTSFNDTQFQLPKKPNQDDIVYSQYEGNIDIGEVESPSPCFDGKIETTTVNTASLKLNPFAEPDRSTFNFLGLKWQNPFYFGPQFEVEVLGREITMTGAYTIDYSKIANNRGRPLIKIRDEKEIHEENSIFFSDNYVQESRINGLNRVRAGNKYVLPSDRTKIVKLQPAWEVLLAIHEHNITSLYIGEGYTKQNNELVLIKTDNVVGDDRVMAEGLGTQNPESIVEYQGTVYGLDLEQGEPWRYHRGMTRLATTYKMKTYFKNKCKAIRASLSDPKIYGGYDPFRHEFLITWPEYEATDGSVVPRETIAFSEKHSRWISRYSFTPEMFGYIGEVMYMFKNGRVYKHEGGSNYNNFFGVSYPSKLKITINPVPRAPKLWEHLVLDSNVRWKITNISDGNGAESNLIETDFEEKEGLFYGEFLRDTNTPTDILSAGQTPLLHGHELKSQYLEIEMEIESNKKIEIEGVDTAYSYATGHYIRQRPEA